MANIIEKENKKYIDKFICLLNDIDFNEANDVIIEENIGNIKVTKKVCEVDLSVNANIKKQLQDLSSNRIFTDLDFFLLGLDKTKSIYIYKKGMNRFCIDNMEILGKEILITDDVIYSTNLVKPELKKVRGNFKYLKDYVTKNESEVVFSLGKFTMYYREKDNETSSLFTINYNDDILLQYENVGKKITYPFVIYLLNKIILDTEEIEDFEVKLGEIKY